MPSDPDSRDELVRLTQLLVVEGTKIAASFAALHGLHQTDIEALTRVLVAEERGEPMTAGVLAQELGLTSGAITFVVDRLERAGHMVRVRDDVDRRKVSLRYSATGRALAEEFFGPFGQHTDDTMNEFTADELEVARRYLAATSAAMAVQRKNLASQTLRPSARGSAKRKPSA